ncbi:MAG: sulfotransferase [Pseudomonadales bacterium]|nr:sulfotransferase [Pseudomonadales bacterium]
MKPIFLLSLPRSGSTLLQRMLASHPQVATLPEPWVLIPPLYALRHGGVLAEYSHENLADAVTDFVAALPRGEADYFAAVRRFAESLYGCVTSDEKPYFLDKTPRYCFIANELIKVFPDAKYVVLWRNPVAALSSRFHSYENLWRWHQYKVDFYSGLNSLIEFVQQNRERIFVASYEQLIDSPEVVLKEMLSYLELEMQPSLLHDFAKVNLQGSMGDKTGVTDYSAVANQPLHKWRETLCNPLRVQLARNMLKTIGQSRLEFMGYDLAEFLTQLNSLPFGYQRLGSDLLRMCYGFVDELLEIGVMRKKLASAKPWRNIYIHR